MIQRLRIVKNPETGVHTVVQDQREMIDAKVLCRLLKAGAPDIYREVWYEVVPPTPEQTSHINGHKRLITPENNDGSDNSTP